MGSLELVEATEVLAPGEHSLAGLAEMANSEHAHVKRSGHEMLDHAIRAGEALHAAKARCERGTWLRWLDGETTMSRRTALSYMRLAEYQEVVRTDVEQPTLRGAELYLRGLPAYSRGDDDFKLPDEVRAEAQRLYAEGVHQAEIARLLDVNRTTVSMWTDPRARERRKQYLRDRKDKNRREREEREKQQRERAIRQAVRKQGGALAEAYAMGSKLDGVLGQARQEAESKDSRLAINEAHALRDKMMEQIIRALGVS